MEFSNWSRYLVLLLAIGAVIDQLEGVSISDVEEQINEFVEATMASRSTPGLSLSIVNGEELFGQGYGVKTLNTTDYVTADTLFYIASTTKAFTATLLSKVLQQRNMSLETPVKEILKNFSLVEYYRQERTTLLDLLGHRVGIPESLYNWVLGAVTTREDIVRRGLYFKATEPFRNAETYSNLFYIAAGLVVQALNEGRVWEDVLTEQIFDPLGMRGTSFMDYLTQGELNHLAKPYFVDTKDNNTMKEISLEFFKHSGLGGPSGSIVSSANDLAKWLYMLTHGGLNEVGERVVDDAVLVNTMSPHTVSYPMDVSNQPLDSVAENYGLGWYTGFYKGYRMVNHAGYMFGYEARATVYPALKIAIFTCINGQYGPDGQIEIHNYITELLMPKNNATTADKGPTFHRPVDTSSTSSTSWQREKLDMTSGVFHHQLLHPVDDSRSTSSSSSSSERPKRAVKLQRRQRRQQKALEEYEGTYGNFAFGNATIVLDTTTGRLRVDYGDLMKGDMVQLADENQFLVRPGDPLWFFPSYGMTFARRAEDNLVVNVTVPILLNSDPPVFVRDLKMDAAPLPPTCDC